MRAEEIDAALRHVIDAKLASHEVRWPGLLDKHLTARHREHHDEA